MRIVLFLLIQLFGVTSAALASELALEDLQQTNALLRAEFDLARSGNPYMLVDLQENQLQLKASGLALQSWRIDHYRRWGHPSALPAVNLENKSSLEEPERNIMVVNAAEKSDADVSKPFKALELTDMPYLLCNAPAERHVNQCAVHPDRLVRAYSWLFRNHRLVPEPAVDFQLEFSSQLAL